MRILVTGSEGMVGYELKKHLKDALFTDFLGPVKLDVTDFSSARELIVSYRPEIIIHLASVTDVDWSERHPEECFRINVDGTKNICRIARETGALMVYPSTFYVYGGDKTEPYDERVDEVIPEKIVGVYSKSKWLGEEAVRKTPRLEHLIVRFGALFGGEGNDKKFVGKVLNLVKSGAKEIRMVGDRRIQPSSVKDTVNNLVRLIESKERGTFNMVGHGSATYAEYAEAILEFAGVKGVKVIPISSEDFKEAAPRAKNLVAVNGRLGETGLDMMRDWRVALKEHIASCLQKNAE